MASKQDKLYKLVYNATLKKLKSCFIIRDLEETNLSKVYLYDPILKTSEINNLKILKSDFSDFDKKYKVTSLPFCYDPTISSGPIERERVYFNSFTYPQWRLHPKTVTELPEIYQDFLDHLTEGDKESSNYILDWLATSLHPDRFEPFLCAVGKKGIGKGILGEILQELHGASNMAITTQKLFSSNFNGHTKNKTIIHLDEIKIMNVEQENILKLLINRNQEFESKNKDAVSAVSYASVYITTNNYDLFTITEDERRFSIPFLTSTDIKNNPKLTSKYKSPDNFRKGCLNDINILNLGSYLLYHAEHCISRDMVHHLESSRTKDIILAGLKEWEVFVLEYFTGEIRNKETGISQISLKRMQDKILNNLDMKRAPGRSKFTALSKKVPEISLLYDNNKKERYLEYSSNDNSH